MDKKKVATLKEESGWLLLSTPSYSRVLVDQLKDKIPWQERSYADYVWKIKPKHLETVRLLLTERATKEGWEFFDHTGQSEETIAEQKEALVQDYLERHVAAVLAVLSKLPKRALRLVEWTDMLTFELREFIGPELFKELAQASLDHYRPVVHYGGHHKREFKQTFIVAVDERIVRALCDLAGATPLDDERGWRSNVEYFVVRDVALADSFEDGIAHFTGSDGSFWIGFPYDKNPVDLSHTHESWQVAVQDTKVYALLEREQTVRKLLDVPESQYVNPGIGNVMVAPHHPSQVALFVHMAHCEAWFRSWGNELLKKDITKSDFGKPWWYEFEWDHPADKIFSHTSASRAGGQAMWNLLGWDQEFVVAQKARIKRLKEAAAQAVIDDMRQHSAELALPLLEAKTVKELLDLGQQHSIDLRPSWSKTKIIQILQADAAINEEVIGLTKRLAA